MRIDFNITSTVSLVEVLVVTLGLIGWLAAAVNIISGWADQGRIRRSGLNGSMKRTVNGNLREEILRVLKLSLFIIIGLLYMTAEPPIRAATHAVTTWAGLCLLTVEVLMVYGSLASFYDRLRLKEDWAREKARHTLWDGSERRQVPDLCPHCQKALRDVLSAALDIVGDEQRPEPQQDKDKEDAPNGNTQS